MDAIARKEVAEQHEAASRFELGRAKYELEQAQVEKQTQALKAKS